jgi:hypothetical protein
LDCALQHCPTQPVAAIRQNPKEPVRELSPMLGSDSSVRQKISIPPLTRIDATTNKVVRQWIGKDGDSLRFGHCSIWLMDYKKGLLSRFPAEEVLNH